MCSNYNYNLTRYERYKRYKRNIYSRLFFVRRRRAGAFRTGSYLIFIRKSPNPAFCGMSPFDKGATDQGLLGLLSA
jgi:hypothetical protein